MMIIEVIKILLVNNINNILRKRKIKYLKNLIRFKMLWKIIIMCFLKDRKYYLNKILILIF
jgi:hypothetical protein